MDSAQQQGAIAASTESFSASDRARMTAMVDGWVSKAVVLLVDGVLLWLLTWLSMLDARNREVSPSFTSSAHFPSFRSATGRKLTSPPWSFKCSSACVAG